MIGIFINLWNRLTGGGTPAPTPALLDTYGGAAAAFSLRKLSSTYGGSAVRVRRSLDNTEQDIGFSGDNLDETALQAFVGYENLFLASESFTSGSWGKATSTVTANAGTDPLGGNNATRYLSNTGNNSYWLDQNISLTVGQSYTMSVWVKSNTGVNQTFRITACNGVISSGAFTATNDWQRFTFSFVAIAGVFQSIISTNYVLNLDVLIFGAQLNQGVTAQTYQQTGSVRNTANGFVTRWYTQDGNGENLLTFSEQFEDSIWTKNGSTVTANSTTAPNGTTTADSFVENATLGYHGTYRSLPITATSGQVYTLSFYVKASTRSWVFMGVTESAVDRAAWFNLSTGTTGTIDAGLTARISDAGSGWYRCSITRTVSGNFTPFFDASTGDGILTYTGNGSTAFFLWGAQLSQSSWLQGYQATTTTAVSRRDASQATAASQPRIVNAGVIERENGKPAVYFNGVSGTELKTTYNVPTNASTFLATFRRHATTGAVLEGIFNADGRGGGIAFYNISPVSIFLDGNGADTATTASITNNLLAHYIMSGLYTGSTTSGTSLFANGYYTNTFTGTGASRISTPLAIGGLTGGGQPARVMRGTVQEGVLYNSNMQPSITAMNLNQNSYYQVYWQGTQQALLDQFGGSAAAFSLRNLSSSYRGPLVRVRRSSDNAETDIGGTFSGDLDVNSLLAFTGGQNSVTNSEDFTNATWTVFRGSASGNTTIAPNGTLTADSIVCNTASSNGLVVLANVVSPVGTTGMTGSCYIKAGNRGFANIVVWDNSANGVRQYYNLTTGELASSFYFGNGSIIKVGASIQNAGNGWYRCSLSISYPTVANVQLIIAPACQSDGNLTCAVGDFGYIWGAQLTTGTVLQPYIPTTTAINGANAFVTKWYDQSGIGDNRLLQSQTFEVTPWLTFQSTVVSNAIVAPDGTLTADKLNENTANNQHYIYQTVTVPTRLNTFSVYLKAGERNLVQLNLYNSTSPFPQFTVIVDLSSGLTRKIDSGGGVTTSFGAQNVGDGWYRVWASGDTVAPAAGGVDIIIRTGTLDSPINSYVGTTGWGVYMWGAQVSDGLELLRYQPTTTAIAPKRDAVQTTAASQPRIVNAGSVESENGKPALFWTDGSGMRLVSSFSPINSPQSFFAVSKLAAVSGIGAASLFDSYEPVQNIYYFTGVQEPPNNRFIYAATNGISVNQEPIPTQDLTSVIRDTTSFIYDNGVLAASGTLPAGTLSGLSIGNLRGNPNPLIPGYDWFGSIQELTVYPTNQSLRTSVQSNINTYYQIYWQGNGTALLDSYSGASAAYSLRNLSSAYTGPLIRVRRSSDNVERDIYGTFRGDLDLAALTSFVGANSGFVTTWYDQSGTGRHATQATAASQPRIVNAGAVDTLGGKPAVFFDGTDDNMRSAINPLATDLKTVFNVFNLRNTTNTFNPISSFFPVLGSYGPTVYLGNSSFEVNKFTNGGSAIVNTSYLLTVDMRKAAGSVSAIRKNSINSGGGFRTNGLGDEIGGIMIGQASSFYGAITAFEFICYTTDVSAAIAPIETNINNYYKIY